MYDPFAQICNFEKLKNAFWSLPNLGIVFAQAIQENWHQIQASLKLVFLIFPVGLFFRRRWAFNNMPLKLGSNSSTLNRKIMIIENLISGKICKNGFFYGVYTHEKPIWTYMVNKKLTNQVERGSRGILFWIKFCWDYDVVLLLLCQLF